ncbi:lysozyme C-1-like [Bombina bombina]|uniref:lysozyme C-1-like n=1 Tax=Bombina bombina TaxID=8345 RepID=UPI00235AF3C7|nr:lysozyme C-1-like [Bombina bombina]
MKLILCLSLLTCLACWIEARRYSQCELLKIFRKTRLDGYRGIGAATWICIAKHESNYRTNVVNNNGPSRDYGIFQINSRWWCNDGKTPKTANGCKKSCSSFLNNDITDDIECAKRVVRDPQGVNAWVVYRKYCKGKDLRKYVRGC